MFRVGGVAIIINRAGDLLLHLRDDIPGITWPGHWSVLGGGADPGETPTEAIVCELDEEARLTTRDLTELLRSTICTVLGSSSPSSPPPGTATKPPCRWPKASSSSSSPPTTWTP